MDDLRLREGIQPLVRAINSEVALSTQRRVRESFDDDDSLRPELINDAFPLQRIDWIVQPGATAGVQVARYQIPGASALRNIAMIATGNVSATFGVDVLVNGVRAAGGAIRVGTSQAKGALNVSVPAGSVVSIETKNSIAQGVTVSVFYRPTED